MTFNLRTFIEQKASKTGLDKTTEGQLDRKGKSPTQLQEGQLDANRGKLPTDLAEKQLNSARTNKQAPNEVTEAQMTKRQTPPNVTAEGQLDADRTTHSEAPVEKRLDEVRNAGFNLHTYLSQKTAKKNHTPTTEGQLKNDNKGPDKLTDAQLDSGHKAVKPVTTQALLEKARTGEADRLVEARLEDNDSKLVKHRNPKAAEGVINKLDEQRIASQDKEEYEAASSTDKKLMLPEVKGKDGLRTASAVPGDNEFGQGLNADAMKMLKSYGIGPDQLFKYDDPNSSFPEIYAGIQAAKSGDNAALKLALEKQLGKPSVIQGMFAAARSKMSRTASTTKTAQFDEPFNIGFMERETPGWNESDTFERVRPNLDRMDELNSRRRRQDRETQALIDSLTKDVEVPSDDEVNAIDEAYDEADPVEDDDLLPEETEGGSLDIPEDFAETSVQDISVGTTNMRQIVLSFAPEDFDNAADVKSKATSYLLSHHPSLFSFKVGRNPIEVSEHLTVMMDEGRATVTLPAAAFKEKIRQDKSAVASTQTL